MVETVALVVFVSCLAVCAYVYFGYPALIWALARWRPRPVAKASVHPTVTFVLAAYNEEAVIGDKIANCLGLDYPPEKVEVIVASNGSTDRTDEIVREWEGRSDRVRLLEVEERGKAYALNAGAAVARGEILAFTDANTALDPDALAKLVRSYADPEVGAVTGNKRPQAGRAAEATAEGEGVYWRYEMWQKLMESRFGSCYIGDGSYHSIRRGLYVPIADPAWGDDISISTRAVLAGYRLIYEPEAVVRERAEGEQKSELQRKMRVTNRSLRALFGLGRHLWTSGFYSLELISHKVLRHLIPFFLIPLFLSNVGLAVDSAFFRLVLAAQVAFYALAVLGHLLRDTRWARAKPLWVPYYFSFVNYAAFRGVLKILAGTRPVTWTPRQGS